MLVSDVPSELTTLVGQLETWLTKVASRADWGSLKNCSIGKPCVMCGADIDLQRMAKAAFPVEAVYVRTSVAMHKVSLLFGCWNIVLDVTRAAPAGQAGPAKVVTRVTRYEVDDEH